MILWTIIIMNDYDDSVVDDDDDDYGGNDGDNEPSIMVDISYRIMHHPYT